MKLANGRTNRRSAGRRMVTNRARFLIRRRRPWLGAATMGGLLLLWEAVARAGLVSPLFLPPPSAVLAAGWEMTASGEIFFHLGASLGRIAAGFVIGAALGTAVGLAMGFFQTIESALSPLVSTTYPIPKIAILPLLILWLGIGEASKVAVIALAVFFPLAINVHAGVRNVDPLLIKAAVSLGSGRRSIIRKVILPASLPMIFAGLRLGIGLALLLVVTAEMIAAQTGIGFLILSAADLMQTTRLMFGIAVLSVLGLLFARLMDRLETLLLPWKE